MTAVTGIRIETRGRPGRWQDNLMRWCSGAGCTHRAVWIQSLGDEGTVYLCQRHAERAERKGCLVVRAGWERP